MAKVNGTIRGAGWFENRPFGTDEARGPTGRRPTFRHYQWTDVGVRWQR